MEGNLTQIAADWGLIVGAFVSTLGGLGVLVMKNPTLFQRADRRSPEPDLTPFKAQIEDIDQRVKNLGGEVNDIKGELKHMPTAQDMHDLELKVLGLSGEIKTVSATTTATRASVLRMEDFLLNYDKRRTLMAPFEGYNDHFDGEIRLIILKALMDDENGTMTDTMLFKLLQTFGVVKDRDYLRTQLDWLDTNASAVVLQRPGTIIVATLTEQGENHVERRFAISGIQKPSRPRG